MAGTTLVPPPIAGSLALDWGRGACNLQLSSSIYDAPVLAWGGWPRPVLCCYSELHVHCSLQDGHPWTYEFVGLPVRECEASRLLSPQGAAEVVFRDVVRILMERTGLPYQAFGCMARMMLLYLRDLAAWALRPGAAPSWTQVRAAIHVSFIAEGEETVGDGFGGQLASLSTAPVSTEATAMDDQLAGRSSEGTRYGEEEEEGGEECCAICLERLAGKERRWLACLHSFHGDCLGRWLRLKAQCPLCRLQVTEEPA